MNGTEVNRIGVRWQRSSKAIRSVGMLMVVLALAASSTSATEARNNTGRTNRWDNVRDPFWPVGYEPDRGPSEAEVERARVEEVEQRIHWPTLRLTGVTRTGDGRHLAILDRVGIVEAGDVIRIEAEAMVYRWRVESITPRGIRTTRIEARPVNP